VPESVEEVPTLPPLLQPSVRVRRRTRERKRRRENRLLVLMTVPPSPEVHDMKIPFSTSFYSFPEKGPRMFYSRRKQNESEYSYGVEAAAYKSYPFELLAVFFTAKRPG
jgi:CRISPR/Cas system Type II protein with McrA/HNH and RuvC-like nuclease domain